MKFAQGLLLAGFAVCAALTVIGQIRYGMLAGRNEDERPGQTEHDERVLACRKHSRMAAVGAVICLACAMLLGALSMR